MTFGASQRCMLASSPYPIPLVSHDQTDILSFEINQGEWKGGGSFGVCREAAFNNTRPSSPSCYSGSEKNMVTPKSSLYRSQVLALWGLSNSSLDRKSLLSSMKEALNQK